jgi:hypothetical protein
VRGSVEVATAGASLSAELFAGRKRSGVTRLRRAGRTLKRDLPAGVVVFKVKLNSPAKRLLVRKRSLRLELRVTLSPRGGQPEQARKAVKLRR